MSRHSYSYNFNKMLRMITRHLLGNYGSDILCWRAIWRIYRPRQQPNIFCIKEVPNHSGKCLILLKRVFFFQMTNKGVEPQVLIQQKCDSPCSQCKPEVTETCINGIPLIHVFRRQASITISNIFVHSLRCPKHGCDYFAAINGIEICLKNMSPRLFCVLVRHYIHHKKALLSVAQREEQPKL